MSCDCSFCAGMEDMKAQLREAAARAPRPARPKHEVRHESGLESKRVGDVLLCIGLAFGLLIGLALGAIVAS